MPSERKSSPRHLKSLKLLHWLASVALSLSRKLIALLFFDYLEEASRGTKEGTVELESNRILFFPNHRLWLQCTHLLSGGLLTYFFFMIEGLRRSKD